MRIAVVKLSYFFYGRKVLLRSIWFILFFLAKLNVNTDTIFIKQHYLYNFLLKRTHKLVSDANDVMYKSNTLKLYPTQNSQYLLFNDRLQTAFYSKTVQTNSTICALGVMCGFQARNRVSSSWRS